MEQNKGWYKTNFSYNLLVLYALEALGSVFEHELQTMLTNEGISDYINTSLAVDDLKKTGEIVSDYGFLSISSKGRESLDFYANKIPNSVRVCISMEALEYKREFTKKRQLCIWYENNDNAQGEILVHLLTQNQEMPKYEIIYYCNNKDNIYYIGECLKANQELLYKKLCHIEMYKNKKTLESPYDSNVEYIPVGFSEPFRHGRYYARVSLLVNKAKKIKIAILFDNHEKALEFIKNWKLYSKMFLDDLMILIK